jgi:putative ABC transport system permease protein
MYLVVRSTIEPSALARSVRAQVSSIDPLLPVNRVRTMHELLGRSVAEPRFRTTLLGIFAAVALVLATIGIYGILSYTVAQRTREIGIRMSLGARPGDVLRLILLQGMTLAGAGVAIGLVLALALSRVLAGLLFGVGSVDLATFGGVALVMGAAAFVACYLPARRAIHVDPMLALRCD